MDNFVYENATKLVFGRGEENNIGELIKPYSKNVLIVYGGGSVKKNGLLDRVEKSLTEASISYMELGGVQPNPRYELASRGVEICKKEYIDGILAVGGGSAIDTAKAIAIGALYDGDFWDFYADNSLVIGDVLPIFTVLTLPAAGSENSTGTVITRDDRKLSCGSFSLRPKVSIVNPELFFTLPKNQIANGICDMMIHILERYYTRTENVELMDGWCESLLRTIMATAPRLMENPHDYDAWATIGLAGTFAHNGVLGVGRAEDWATHDFEHELSAKKADFAHGAGLAILTPAYMKYVYKTDIARFSSFAYNVMGVTPSDNTEEDILKAIDLLSEFFKSIGLPSRLRDAGFTPDDFEEMAKKATGAYYGNETPLGNFRPLLWRDIVNIYNIAY